ncbi:MAG: glutathione S-transferase N-terminal domain-containing protein [Deltaproteobacteria bacterium]|nr:glutathione S-transferase N-terminal domain-containing protein [Deltaproteobacteria bacterium]
MLVLLAATEAPVLRAVVYNHFRHVVLPNAAYSSNLKLYITETSPYARAVRVVLLEKGLEDRVEILVAETRVSDSPYYRINPSGRVPYLIRDDGIALEESALICAYLDQLDEKPGFDPPDGEQAWEARCLEALARSLLDGLAVWGRELRRPRNERSPTILEHEAHRSVRMADLWELQFDHPLMRGALNMAQITLACALGLEARSPHLRWRPGHPKLSAWFDAIATRPSLAATAPPAPG